MFWFDRVGGMSYYKTKGVDDSLCEYHVEQRTVIDGSQCSSRKFSRECLISDLHRLSYDREVVADQQYDII